MSKTDMDKIPLGKETEYPKVFDKGLLFVIPREQARENLSIFKDHANGSDLPFLGFDEWTLYEVCWKDLQGNIEMGIGVLRIPCDSTYIVESKSLKLYINSLYYHCFDSRDELVRQVSSDLAECLNSDIQFFLYSLDDVPDYLSTSSFVTKTYQSLDSEVVGTTSESSVGSQNLLKRVISESGKSHSGEGIYRYKTARFRSLCPVTGQPDWASIYISVAGMELDKSALATYFIGFAEHQGFHENCVERIYVELQQSLSPEGLCVAARYTRRGGIDINPIRSSCDTLLTMPAREIRQ